MSAGLAFCVTHVSDKNKNNNNNSGGESFSKVGEQNLASGKVYIRKYV